MSVRIVDSTLAVTGDLRISGEIIAPTIRNEMRIVGDTSGTEVAQLRITNSSGTELYFEGSTIATVSAEETMIFLAGLNASNPAHVMKWGSAGDNTHMSLVNGNLGIGTESPNALLHVAGPVAFSGPDETFVTFADGDATPSVSTGNIFKTEASTQTITMFDDGVCGQIITVISTAAITYDVTGTNLKGGSTDLVTADGESTIWVFDGTNWYLIGYMDLSQNYNVDGV